METRRCFLSTQPLLFCALSILISAQTIAQSNDASGVSARARAIQDSAIVVDTHADTPQRFLDENFDIGSTDPKDIGHISLDRARAGNLGAEFFSIWVDPEINKGHFAQHTLDLIDSVYEQAARHPDRMMMAFSVDDIERAHKQKKLAALMGIEGGHSIENDIHLLRDFYRLGVRYMTLSWSNTNEWADSSGDIDDPKVPHHNGLTDFGKQVVLEMNRLGMMVDISHVADKTFWDAIATSKAPVIASHSSARALTNAPRNMTDDMLARGGEKRWRRGCEFLLRLLGSELLECRSGPGQSASRRDPRLRGKTYELRVSRSRSSDEDRIEREWMAKMPRPPFTALIDHIDHIAKVAGVDHVGLGSDFDGVAAQRRWGWTPPPTCPRSRKRWSIAVTAPTTFVGFSAAMYCAYSKKWKRSAVRCSLKKLNLTSKYWRCCRTIQDSDLDTRFTYSRSHPCANA